MRGAQPIPQAGASRSPSAASWLGVSPPTRLGAANALVQDYNWLSNAHRRATSLCQKHVWFQRVRERNSCLLL